MQILLLLVVIIFISLKPKRYIVEGQRLNVQICEEQDPKLECPCILGFQAS